MAVMHIWLNNAAAALLLSSLSSVHPLIAYLRMIPVAASEGHVLSSWLAGYLPYAHLIYSLMEDQAYIASSICCRSVGGAGSMKKLRSLVISFNQGLYFLYRHPFYPSLMGVQVDTFFYMDSFLGLAMFLFTVPL